MPDDDGPVEVSDGDAEDSPSNRPRRTPRPYGPSAASDAEDSTSSRTRRTPRPYGTSAASSSRHAPSPQFAGTLSTSAYPPNNLDLSDAWTVAIVNCSKLSRDDRGIRWPAVFTVKGALRSTYIHKGQPAKRHDSTSANVKYVLLDGVHNMYGSEGRAEGLPAKRPTQLEDVDPMALALEGKQPLHLSSKWLRPQSSLLVGKTFCIVSDVPYLSIAALT